MENAKCMVCPGTYLEFINFWMMVAIVVMKISMFLAV